MIHETNVVILGAVKNEVLATDIFMGYFYEALDIPDLSEAANPQRVFFGLLVREFPPWIPHQQRDHVYTLCPLTQPHL